MSQAETRKVVIDPVTRVEGHGRVTIKLKPDGKVDVARLHIVEFRGFERFIQGRMYWEAAVVIQRLCGICPVSHHLAAAKAMDAAIGATQLTPTAEKMRRLMHYGQVFQSNALHFFHLAAPDLLFGFDAPAMKRNVIALAQENPELGKRAILLRKYGQEIIKATGGKKVHPTSAIPGGINTNLSIEDRDRLRKDVDQMLGWGVDALELAKKLAGADLKRHAEFGSFPSSYVSLVRKDGAMDLYDGGLRAIDANGKKIFDHVQPEEYLEYIAEEVRPWSYMKFPHIRALGKEKGWYRVGPLAHMNVVDFIDTPIAEKERVEFLKLGKGKPVHSTLGYHWSRVIDLIHAGEKIKELLYDNDLQGTELMAKPKPGPRPNEGVGWIEAPRGTLFHHYKISDTDQIERANLIVSTTNNNEAMNRTVQSIAEQYLSGREITEGLLNHIEVGIRAYDPCLSCATHAVGRMPLIVTLEGPDGEELDRKVRFSC